MMPPRRLKSAQSTGEGGWHHPSLSDYFVGYMVWLMTLPMVSAAERFIPFVAWV